ncbi:bifunctional methylenetetrahydrofolate dehydrogenase/methenyltetrahydrofolate cyclohydrolase FolD [Sphingomonas sp. AP4-R1]|uniref:bifunctional methylenetetrahydrofolate dehydrogenase/methenyltetrahydrofolate cyclohydrolase FolD n=1 Tax=Sphingomonas sp. AP4-R1 TaxID=2735134 RepID=UPI001493941F|nr:bifunctional methylenetetrahydrofolate dehydrogenase/methenyltetrahydrofolate cyclohydrolase FolD [Sphingomonas sp. AP4-R1]QJU56902.1 bifunctional methylenetetrahydrofolate dehydrogenase/methenyltetrahydrofolate cyclohydrolase FolD [Sphingomonas sp. AP4-R1]
MSATIIDGKAFAASLRERVGAVAADFARAAGRQAGLTVVLVGEDAASSVYVRSKERASIAANIAGTVHRLPATTTQDELLALVATLNADPAVDGILVQLPLPKQIDSHAIIAAIDPDKDVDGFHPVNAGRLASGLPGFVPCTPLGCLMLLKDRLGSLSGLEAVVVGRSNIVGKPMAQLLLAESCTVTIAHSRTRDLAATVGRSDIVVAAVGVPELVRGAWIKPGATVIDVGINRVTLADGTSKLVGDVAFEEAADVAGAITPVPGGVGPMTIAVLLRNTLVSAYRREGLALDESAL